MKIYQIKPDLSFHRISPMVADSKNLIFPFDSESKWASWNAAFGTEGARFRVENPATTRKGNFFFLGTGVLVHDQKVAEEADEVELFANDIEYLPALLEDTGERLFVENIMGCYNCLDRANSKMSADESGGIISVEKHAFFPGRILDSTIFKIPETADEAIYALSGRGEEDFSEIYREFGWTGLVFEEVWSDE